MAGVVGLSILISGGAGFFKGMSYEKDKAAVALAKAVDKARQTEQNLHDDYGVLNDLKDEELRRVVSERDAAVRGLRSRPSRLPSATAPACQGATGAQLSREDAEAFTGLASDADQLQARYDACQAREWSAYEALRPK